MTASGLMEEDIRDAFSAVDVEIDDKDPAIMHECVSLCSSLGLTASQLADHWEVFHLNLKAKGKSDASRVQRSLLAAFRRHLDAEMERTKVTQTADDFVPSGGGFFYSRQNMDELVEMAQGGGSVSAGRKGLDLKTPQKIEAVVGRRGGEGGEADGAASRDEKSRLGEEGNAGTPQATPRKKTPFSSRGSSGEQLLSLGSMEEAEKRRENEPIRDRHVCVLGAPLEEGVRFMFDSTESRFSSIENRNAVFTRALTQSSVGSSFDRSKQTLFATQDRVLAVGRICCEGEADRLNEQSIAFEGCVDPCRGVRVKLDVRNLPEFSFFPGQVVAVEGDNPSGFCLVASKVISHLPPPPFSPSLLPPTSSAASSSSSSAAAAAQKRRREEVAEGGEVERGGEESIRVMVAAGPFSTSDNLDFEPLEALLSEAAAQSPDLLLLIGPFVDSEHPSVRCGSLDESFSQAFQRRVRTRVESFLESSPASTRVALVPSLRDAFHDSVFPQPPFSHDDFEDPANRILTLGNPGLLACGGLSIAVTSLDVLRQLSSHEASRLPAGAAPDRMARLASHLIGQRSLYPIFPPPAGTPLDLSLAAAGCLDLPFAPDLLLLPSDLAPFAKLLSYVPSASPPSSPPADFVCINPGRVSKGVSGGTFAKVLLARNKEGSLEASAVDVKRI